MTDFDEVIRQTSGCERTLFALLCAEPLLRSRIKKELDASAVAVDEGATETS